MFFDINKTIVKGCNKFPYTYVYYSEELIGSVPLNVETTEMAMLIAMYDSLYFHEDQVPSNKVIYLNFFLDSEHDIYYWGKAMSGEAY